MKIYKRCSRRSFSFLTTDTTLPANNSLGFKRKSFKSFIKMTLTDDLNNLDGKTKANQSEYDIDREAAKMPVLSSKELFKYEYLTGEDLEYKPEVLEEINFEYSPLGETLSNKAKSKTDKRNKVVNTDKQGKNLFYNSQHSFVKFKDIRDFKELSLGFMHTKRNDFHKKFVGIKKLTPQAKENKDLRANVLGNVRDHVNEWYDIYKKIYKKQNDALTKKT